MTLDAKKFGLAGGAISALFMIVLALAAGFGHVGSGLIDSLGSLYVGYRADVMGGLLGAIWGFVEGFITFYLIAWVYDRLISKTAG